MDAPICRQTTAIVVRVAPSVQAGQAAIPVVVSARLDKQHAAAHASIPKPIANTVAHAERLATQESFVLLEVVSSPVQPPKSNVRGCVSTQKLTTTIAAHAVQSVPVAKHAQTGLVPVHLDKQTAMAFV
jgi:hypothetical protein